MSALGGRLCGINIHPHTHILTEQSAGCTLARTTPSSLYTMRMAVVLWLCCYGDILPFSFLMPDPLGMVLR